MWTAFPGFVYPEFTYPEFTLPPPESGRPERIMGPFPSYANGPAWDGLGLKLSDGTVVLVWRFNTSPSLGALAQGAAAPPPQFVGVYRDSGNPDRGWKRIRDATPEEIERATAQVIPYLAWEREREAHEEAEQAARWAWEDAREDAYYAKLRSEKS
jgi:hypothetical protein